MSKTIFFSVGEPSGDQHAGHLIETLSQNFPDVKCRGFGGANMRAAGCDVDLDLTEHAVFGLLEVLPKLRDFFRFADQAEAAFKAGEVDAVVLVDFPGFNWHIARRAKKYGIPVTYYCPPQLWAWGGWRVRKMKRTVDHVLAVLPIEEQFFGGHGIDTHYVGHPFFDDVHETILDQETLKTLEQRCDHGPTVAVLPGSRTHEVHQNFPVMLAAIRELSARHPAARFAVAAYRPQHMQFCEELTAKHHGNLPIDFYCDATSEIVEHADCAMMVSGSVSLELMARQTPAAVIYRVGRFLHTVGRNVIKVDSMTLPNLMPCDEPGPVKGERVFPETVSVGDPRPAKDFLVQSIDRMLADGEYLSGKRRQLNALTDLYARPGATERAAVKLGDWLDLDGAEQDQQRAA